MTLSGIIELKKIAVRNLARHRLKTVLTAAAITVSVAVYIFLNCWLGGAAEESRRNIVNYEMGAAKLQTKLYFEKKDEMPGYETFPDWETYRGALESEGWAGAPRFVFNGTLFSTSGSAPVLFNAVDPAGEAEVFRYVPYVDFGRYVQNGNFEIALGTTAAEKLKIGIPTRPFRNDLEELIAAAARNDADRNFIRGLYESAPSRNGGFFAPPKNAAQDSGRVILKKNAARADLDRFWNMIAQTGRNEVRINAVIDMKAVPETIRGDKWEGELLPALSTADQKIVQGAYQYEDFLEAYALVETDENKLAEILTIMIRAGFSGAVRHVNQLIDAVVVGVINSPAPLPNGNTAYIPLDVLQDEAGMMLEGAVTEIVIRNKKIDDTTLPAREETLDDINAALEKGLAARNRALPETLSVYFWTDYMSDYLNYEKLQTGAPQVIAALLLILSLLGISNTILMAILERAKETGMMRALGMSDRQMVMVYMMEAGFIGFAGSIAGIIIACVINYPMVKYGIDFSAIADTLSGGIGFRTTGNFRSVWNVPLIIGSGIAATLLSSVMAFFPTRKAVKMAITASLRFE